MTKKLKSSTIIGGGKNEDRQHLDFYPTPIECTVALLDFLDIPKDAFILEPACGDGAISKILEERGYKNVISSDIRPDTGYGLGGIDFLTSKVHLLFDAVITNPPFNLAELFIRKSLSQAPVVAMLLKATYFHTKSRIDLFENHPPSMILPLTWRVDFLNKGNPTMDFMWVVWEKGSKATIYQPLKRPSK